MTGDAARIDALAAAVDRRPGRAAVAAARARGRRARGLAAAHRSWPAACWCSARSSGGARPAGESRAALRRAAALAAEMGHRPLLEPRSSASCRERSRRRRSDGDLTAAEQRVADQIAGGATSREAAAALFVSVRTVETHVASIYRKLGVRTRAELTRALSGRPGR